MQNDRWSIALDTDPDPSLRSQILAPLVAYNESAGGPANSGRLAVTVRNSAGEIVGGLWGTMAYGFLFIELLTLGTARGMGLGRKVMDMAEAEARGRGLLGMWLDTWTFQAPGFYSKLGFVECGRICGYPPGHDRIFYVKRFSPIEGN